MKQKGTRARRWPLCSLLYPSSSLRLASLIEHISCDVALDIRRRAGIDVQMIEIDVNHFHVRRDAFERHGITALESLGVVDRAFPVAMVELSRSDERKEPQRIDFIHDAFGDDLNVIAEPLVNIGNAAAETPHGTKD